MTTKKPAAKKKAASTKGKKIRKTIKVDHKPVDVAKRQANRPSLYCESIQIKCDEYLASCPDNIPSIVGLARHLGVVTRTLYNWADIESNTELVHTLVAVKEYQHHFTLNGAITGDLNPVISKLVLNNHGYSDKQQTELTGAEGGAIQHDHVVEFVGVNSGD